MQLSGYPQEKNTLLHRKALKVFKRIQERNESAQCIGKSLAEKRKRRNKKYIWLYEQAGHEMVMFVEASPNKMWAKSCRTALKEAERKIRIIDIEGKSLKIALKKLHSF